MWRKNCGHRDAGRMVNVHSVVFSRGTGVEKLRLDLSMDSFRLVMEDCSRIFLFGVGRALCG